MAETVLGNWLKPSITASTENGTRKKNLSGAEILNSPLAKPLLGKKKIEIIGEGIDLFVVVDGVGIAKRSQGSWMPLEPGWIVRDVGTDISISRNGVPVHRCARKVPLDFLVEMQNALVMKVNALVAKGQPIPSKMKPWLDQALAKGEISRDHSGHYVASRRDQAD